MNDEKLIIIAFFKTQQPKKYIHGQTITNYWKLVNYLKRKYSDYDYSNLYYKESNQFFKRV